MIAHFLILDPFGLGLTTLIVRVRIMKAAVQATEEAALLKEVHISCSIQECSNRDVP